MTPPSTEQAKTKLRAIDAQAAVEAKRGGRRFRLMRFSEMPWSPAANYLIKNLIPREGLVVIWGPPKSGKSFWAWDALMHVALGWQYRGRKVVQGPVVYLACEGERGLGARAEAFRRKHGLTDSDPPFFLVTTRLDLAADAQALIADIRSQIGPITPHAIAIDTLNRSIGGSESNDEDMGGYIRAADAIREAFGCVVAVVHHCGIDTKRPRGHTSLTGAADAQLACKRDESGLICVTVEWLKDGHEGDVIASRLAVVELGTDADGDEITSCVIEPSEEAASSRRTKPLTGRNKLALADLNNALCDIGVLPPTSPRIPNGFRVVTLEQWRDRMFSAGTLAKDASNPREDFRRVQVKLKEVGAIGIWDNQVWSVPNA